MTSGVPAQAYRPGPLDPVAVCRQDGSDAAQGIVVRVLDDRVVLACAASRESIGLGEGEPVRATFFGQRGSFTGACQVAAPISGHPREIVLTMPASINRTQRRAFLRVPMERPVRASRDGAWVTGYTKNLSGGGALVTLPIVFRSGDRLTVEIDLEDASTVRASARVVRVDADEVQIAMQFVAISERDRDRVIRAVWHEEQRRAVIHRSPAEA